MKKSRILLVDDDPQVLAMLTQLLSRNGYAVHAAGNGKQAMRILRDEEVDLLVTDIIMPEVEGLELITTVRRQYPGLKIVVISGGSPIMDPKMPLYLGKKLGANLTFRKPFKHREFLDALESLLDGSTV